MMTNGVVGRHRKGESKLAGSCEAHLFVDDAREHGAKEQDPVQEHPKDRQHDGRPVGIVLAFCVAQHERSVCVIYGLEAHLGCDRDLDDDDEMEKKTKLPWHADGVDHGLRGKLYVLLGGWVGGCFHTRKYQSAKVK